MFVVPLIAVAGILLAVWFFGVRRPASIEDADVVRHLLRVVHPEFVPTDIALDPGGSRALATDASGTGVMLLFAMGNQVAVRVLDLGGVRRVDVNDRADGCRDVVVHLHDLGCPRVPLILSAADAPRWGARLERLAGAAAGAVTGDAPLARVSPPS